MFFSVAERIVFVQQKDNNRWNDDIYSLAYDSVDAGGVDEQKQSGVVETKYEKINTPGAKIFIF